MDKLHKLKIIRGNKRKKMQRLTRELEEVNAEIEKLNSEIEKETKK